MQEIWVAVKGYEGLYKISNYGDIKSVRRGLVLTPVMISGGYYQVTLYNKGRRKNYRIHRIVAEHFIPNVDNKPEVNHIDGDKSNDSVPNLEWVSSRENIIHAFDTGLRVSHGEHNNFHKLSNTDVLEVYDLAHSGLFKQSEIGAMYNVHKDTVSAIKRKKNWRHLLDSR